MLPKTIPVCRGGSHLPGPGRLGASGRKKKLFWGAWTGEADGNWRIGKLYDPIGLKSKIITSGEKLQTITYWGIQCSVNSTQSAAPVEVPGIRKAFSLRRMNPAVRNWNMPLLDASFRILVPLHQNRSRHVNCFQAHKA